MRMKPISVDDCVFLLLTLSVCVAARFLLSRLFTTNSLHKSRRARAKRFFPSAGPRHIPLLSPILWLRRSSSTPSPPPSPPRRVRSHLRRPHHFPPRHLHRRPPPGP
ncbi:unnamed protein product [Musa acuminata subsp. burmannicoides]